MLQSYIKTYKSFLLQRLELEKRYISLRYPFYWLKSPIYRSRERLGLNIIFDFLWGKCKSLHSINLDYLLKYNFSQKFKLNSIKKKKER